MEKTDAADDLRMETDDEAFATEVVAASQRRYSRETQFKDVSSKNPDDDPVVGEYFKGAKALEGHLRSVGTTKGPRRRGWKRLKREIARILALACERMFLLAQTMPGMFKDVCFVASWGLYYCPEQANHLCVRGLAFVRRGLVVEGLRDLARALKAPAKDWHHQDLRSQAKHVIDSYATKVDRGAWTTIDSTNAPRGRADAASCVDGNAVYIFGGFFRGKVGECVDTDEFWRLDVTTMEWDLLSGGFHTKIRTSPSPRIGARAVSVSVQGGKRGIVVHGGTTSHDHSFVYSDIWLFSHERRRWRCLNPRRGNNGKHAPGGRHGHVLVAVGSTVYCWGGRIDDDDDDPSALWALDVGGKNCAWTRVATTGVPAPAPRIRAAFWIVDESSVMIVGGHCINTESDIIRPGGETLLENLGGPDPPTWTIRGHSTWIPPHSEAAAARDATTCWYFGGYSDTFHHYNFFDGDDGVTATASKSLDFYYNSLCRFVAGEWRYVVPSEGKVPRCAAQAVAFVDPNDGSLLLFGGYSAMNDTDTFLQSSHDDQELVVFDTLWRCTLLPFKAIPAENQDDEDRPDYEHTRDPTTPLNTTTTDSGDGEDPYAVGRMTRIRDLKTAVHLNGQVGKILEDRGDRVAFEILSTRKRVLVPKMAIREHPLFEPVGRPGRRGERENWFINYDSWITACREIIIRDPEMRRTFSTAWMRGIDTWISKYRGPVVEKRKAALVARYDPWMPPLPRDQMHPANFVFVDEDDVAMFFDKPYDEWPRTKWVDFLEPSEGCHVSANSPLVSMNLVFAPLWPMMNKWGGVEIPTTDDELTSYGLLFRSYFFSLAPGVGAMPCNVVLETTKSSDSDVDRMLSATAMGHLLISTGTVRTCCADGCNKVERRLTKSHFSMANADFTTFNANSVETLQSCSNCLSVWYCSKECQVNDWQRHKKECPRLQMDRIKSRQKNAAGLWGDDLHASSQHF